MMGRKKSDNYYEKERRSFSAKMSSSCFSRLNASDEHFSSHSCGKNDFVAFQHSTNVKKSHEDQKEERKVSLRKMSDRGFMLFCYQEFIELSLSFLVFLCSPFICSAFVKRKTRKKLKNYF